MGYVFDQRRLETGGNVAGSVTRDPGRGTASWQLPAVNAPQPGRPDGKRLPQNPDEGDKSQFERDLEAAMQIDWSTFGEAWQNDLAYFREHPLEAASKLVFLAGVGLVIATVAGPWVAYGLLASGFLHSVYRWFAGVRAAGGDEAKIQQLRLELAHLIETAVVSGAIIGLRWLRTGGSASAEERLPAVRGRPAKAGTIARTEVAGHELTKPDQGHDPDVFDADGKLLIPHVSGASPTLDNMGSGGWPGGGFVPPSREFLRSLKDLEARGSSSLDDYKEIVLKELQPHDVLIPDFHEGEHARFIVTREKWQIEIPRRWMNGHANRATVAGQLARLVNEVLEYWTVALYAAKSPTRRAQVLPYFRHDVARKAIASYDVLPLPIRDPARVESLLKALSARLDWNELNQLRIDHAEPMDNFMTEAFEEDLLTTSQNDVRRLRNEIREHSGALGSLRAFRWARIAYNDPTGLGPATPQLRQRSLCDDFEFSGTAFSRIEVLGNDMKHPVFTEEDIRIQVRELLTLELGNWRVPPIDVAFDEETRIDLVNWRVVIARRKLDSDQWEELVVAFAHLAVKIRQHWTMLKYRLSVMPPEQHQNLESEFPKFVVAAAKRQPSLTPEEASRARQLDESISSPERIVVEERASEIIRKLQAEERNLKFAIRGYDLADEHQKPAAARRREVAAKALADAATDFQRIETKFLNFIDYAETRAAMEKTRRRVRSNQ